MPNFDSTHSGPACTLCALAAARTIEMVKTRVSSAPSTRHGSCKKEFWMGGYNRGDREQEGVLGGWIKK